jgi:protein tyrosine phosphatase
MQAAEDDPAAWQYVATQGPMPHTVHMFWHMVVEQQCSAIVMLTDAMEGNAGKCCQYFPQQTETSLTVCRISKQAAKTDCLC